MDAVVTALAFHRVTKIDWYSCGGFDDVFLTIFPGVLYNAT